MRCPTHLCHSQRTHRLTRTLVLHYDNRGRLVGAQSSELWLCDNCGEPFKPGVSRVVEWDKVPVTASVARGVKFGKRRRLTKAAIIREIFPAREA